MLLAKNPTPDLLCSYIQGQRIFVFVPGVFVELSILLNTLAGVLGVVFDLTVIS